MILLKLTTYSRALGAVDKYKKPNPRFISKFSTSSN